jgi:hypothetical protein
MSGIIPEELLAQTIEGTRNWSIHRPSLEEVREWQASRKRYAKQRICISFTGAGFARLHAMREAEKRFKEQGLL